MPRDGWVKTLGLDTDGTLFVALENGTVLYDTCLNTPLPQAVNIQVKDLMKAKNRHLYYRFHATLNEISELIYNDLYDRDIVFKPGDVVVDAGARIGTFTAKISGTVGKTGRIVAVEPEPRNYACLVKNIRLNRLDNVIPVRKMLWSGPRAMDLFLAGNAASHSAYHSPFFGSTGESVPVEADSLDRILEAARIGPVDFIKMDIEGSEFEALQGMGKTLESCRNLAVASYHLPEGQPTHPAVVRELERVGFEAVLADGLVRARRNRPDGSGLPTRI
jgi:FkbM family methyltransferase